MSASMVATNNNHRAQWRRDDLLLLLRAWRDVAEHSDDDDDNDEDDNTHADEKKEVEEPSSGNSGGGRGGKGRLYDEKISDFDARVYRRFLALSCENDGDGGEETEQMSRTERAVIEKKDAIMHSYHFIAEFIAQVVKLEQPTEAVEDSKAETAVEAKDWFSMRKDEQKRVVRDRYKRTSFVYLDEEMFGQLKSLAEQKQKSKMRDRVGFQHWDHSEHIQLLRAWREALDVVQRKRDLNRTITERFIALSRDGKQHRTESSIIVRKDNMVFSYTFISEFSEDKKETDWFSLSRAEKKKEIEIANHKWTRFVDIDEGMFDVIAMLLHTKLRSSSGEASSAVATPPQSEPEQRVVDSSHAARDHGSTSGSSETLAEKDPAGPRKSTASPARVAMLNVFEKYAAHFNAALRHVEAQEDTEREGRKRDREVLSVELDERQRYREELVRDREERASERLVMNRELGRMREERRSERESDLELLRTLLSRSVHE